jgi:hypothetical protein
MLFRDVEVGQKFISTHQGCIREYIKTSPLQRQSPSMLINAVYFYNAGTPRNSTMSFINVSDETRVDLVK